LYQCKASGYTKYLWIYHKTSSDFQEQYILDMNSTFNTMGNNTMHDLTLMQLQQQAQQLIQQNTILAAQLQLTRSQSMYNQPPQQIQAAQQPSIPSKQPAQRSLSELYYPTSPSLHQQQQQQRSMPPTTPPGLCTSAVTQQKSQSSILAQLPQAPCIALQRRDSVKSDGSQQQQVDNGRYKTEMCRPFEETGHCRYGAKCQFAHGINELRGLNRHPRYKTEFCRTFHTTGFCSYGQRCNFIHNEEERRGSSPQTSTSSSCCRPHHMPLHVTSSTGSIGSTGSSPANSVYGGDISPSHSPSYMSEDPFSSRLSPAPSLSSFNSDFSSNMSFPSPPGTPLHSDCDYSESTTLSSALEMGLSLSLLNKLNF